MPRKPLKEEIPNGRPLFKRELSKVGPAPNQYNVRAKLGQKKNPNQSCVFGISYGNYRKTCDISKDIKIYDYAANSQNLGLGYPTLGLAKKAVPGYSQSKSKQRTLWHDEEKRSLQTPGPVSYNSLHDRIVQMTRFEQKGAMGLDVKCN